MELNDQQYEILKSYESYLMTAYENNYVRSLPFRDATVLSTIYKELGLGSINLHCPKCVLTLCKTLGKLYSYKKRTYEKR